MSETGEATSISTTKIDAPISAAPAADATVAVRATSSVPDIVHTGTTNLLDDEAIRVVTWGDLTTDNTGKIVTISGCDVSAIKVPQLRLICGTLKVGGYRSAKKNNILEMLATYMKTKQVYEHTQQGSATTRKTINCNFRLLNLLFSDKFAEDYSHIGDAPTRADLDGPAGTATCKLFWTRVQESYVDDVDKYNEVMFEEYFFSKYSINPSVIVQHDWKKLMANYKEVNAAYKESLVKFTASGNHDSVFFNFCSGRLDAYYLWLHLQQRPELLTYVNAVLQPGVFSDSSSPNQGMAELQSTALLTVNTN